MTSLDIITNLQGFEEALAGVKDRAGPLTEIRLASLRKVKGGELAAKQDDRVLVIGCNPADKYMVGVAIMSVFEDVPISEHVSSTTKYNEEMLRLVKRQTMAMEDIAKILRARA